MARFYFVRHGESESNVQGICGGQLDIPLTEKGHEQAILTGKRILEQGIHADEIIASPLQRAQDTAAHIADMTGLPVRTDARLIEQHCGEFQGTVPKKPPASAAPSCPQFAMAFGKTGESTLRVAQRIYNLLDELSATGKTYILVSHNGVARVIRSYFEDMSTEEFSRYYVPNCSIVELDA